MLASLGMNAQETSSFVVNNSDGRGVKFDISKVDSISFNSADAVKVYPAETLLDANSQLTTILDEVKEIQQKILSLQSEQNFLSREKDWLLYRYDDVRNMLFKYTGEVDTLKNDTHANIKVLNSDIHLAAARIDSLHASTINRIDSLHSICNSRADSLFQALAAHRQKADSIFHRLDSISYRTDSIIAQLSDSLFQRTDSVVHQTELMVQHMQKTLESSMANELSQQKAMMQQHIDRLTFTVDSLTAALAETNRRLNSVQVITDTSTGLPYKLLLNNGTITPIPAYSNILVLGNSFSTHDYKENLWWSTHSMAASTADVGYIKYLEEMSGTEVDIMRGWQFEWNYQNADFNFSAILPVTKNYDVVIVQIQENAWPDPQYDYQAAWERLYTYLKACCPNSIFMQCIGWYEESRYEGIVKAASKFNIPIIDNREAVATGTFSVGDYVLGGEDGEYHAINNSSVARHPSDVGFVLMANNILRQLNLPTVEHKLHALNLSVTAGGTLSVPYPQWPEKGLVSVRCIPDDGKTCTSVTVTAANGSQVEATKRVNNELDGTPHTYFTFIMPPCDVTITPVWE